MKTNNHRFWDWTTNFIFLIFIIVSLYLADALAMVGFITAFAWFLQYQSVRDEYYSRIDLISIENNYLREQLESYEKKSNS